MPDTLESPVQEKDEYGIPVRKTASTTDEYGIPIKKKDLTPSDTPAPQPKTDWNGLLQKQDAFSPPLQNGGKKDQPGKQPAETPLKDRGSWANLPTFGAREVFGGLEKDLGNLTGYLKDNLHTDPITKLALGTIQDFWRKGQEKDEQVSATHQLPNTTAGHVASTVTKFIPDIIELAATPELDIAKLGRLGEFAAKGGKIGTKVAKMAVGKFPIQQATKNMLQSYSDAKDKGADDGEANVQALKGFAEGYKNGVIFEGAAGAGGKLTKLGTDALEKVGLMAGNKLVAGAEKRLLHATAQGITFSAAPILQNAAEGKGTDIKEITGGGLFGSVLALLTGHGEPRGAITDADKAAAQVIMRKPLVDLHNFANADMDEIKFNHERHATPEDLQAWSASHAERGFKEEDPDRKAHNVLMSSIYGKASSIKAITNAVLKDKQGVIDEVSQLDLPDEAKASIVDKINQVHKELDPTEQKKTALANQIKELQDAPAEDLVAEKEKAVKVKDLNKQLDEIINTQFEAAKNSKPDAKPLPDEPSADAPGKSEVAGAVNHDETTNNQITTNPQNNESKNDDAQKGQEGESQSPAEKGDEESRQNEKGLKVTSGEAEPKPEKPRFQIKGDKITPLPIHEHAELNGILQNEHGITIQDLKNEHEERNKRGEDPAQAATNEETVQQPENDGTGNDGEHRQGEGAERSKSTFKKPEAEKLGDKEGVKKTILTQRAYEGEISEEVKKHLEEKGLRRSSFTQEERSKQAGDFINKFGDEAAYHAVKSGDVDGGLAASILTKLQIKNSRAIEDANPEDVDALAKKQADYIDLLEKKGYLGGEFNGQLAHEYQNEELNYANIKRQVEKSTDRPITPEQAKKIKDLTDKNDQLKKQVEETEARLIDESNKAFEAGKEEAKNETKAQKAKRLADKIRSGKIHRPGLFSAASPASLAWDTAVELTAKSVEAGGKLVDAIEAGVNHIKSTDWYKSLSDNKKQQAEKEFKDYHLANSGSTDLEDLQERFLNKKDNKFTPNEAKDIWKYMRDNYIDQGTSYRDAISKTSEDLGLSWRQIGEAIVTPKLKRASDEMWKRQADLARNRAVVKDWVADQIKPWWLKAIRKVTGTFRGVAVFGHGGIFVGTHAGATLFNPATSGKTMKAFLNGWKFAYGNEAKYERAMEELKHSPNYVIAQRAGLNNNPERMNAEEYQRSQKYLGRLGIAGEKGFNAIKILRQGLFDHYYEKLSPAERDDPAALQSIAKLMNLATGATNLKLPSWVNEVTFAGGMEASRWGKLTRNPLKATETAIKAITSPDKVTTADRVFAKVWAKRVGTELATMTGALIVNAALQKQLNPKNPVNLTDPNRADFGKMKFGDLTIDATSGMLGTASFMYKIGKIPFENQKALHGEKRINVIGKDAAGYARGKLSPFYSTIADVVSHQDFSGNTLPWNSDKPSKGGHKLSYPEYILSKAPLPVAEAVNVAYKSAVEDGADKPQLQNIMNGLLSGVISGSTGFRVSENNGKMKKVEIKLLPK